MTIGNVIIPIDELHHFSGRGGPGPPTSDGDLAVDWKPWPSMAFKSFDDFSRGTDAPAEHIAPSHRCQKDES